MVLKGQMYPFVTAFVFKEFAYQPDIDQSVAEAELIQSLKCS